MVDWSMAPPSGVFETGNDDDNAPVLNHSAFGWSSACFINTGQAGTYSIRLYDV